MIYTVTFNPAIDYLVYVPELKVGSIIRSEKEKTFCGGKGINVSLVLQELGIESTAMGFIAGFTGSAIEQALGGGIIHTDFVHLNEGFADVKQRLKKYGLFKPTYKGAVPDNPGPAPPVILLYSPARSTGQFHRRNDR